MYRRILVHEGDKAVTFGGDISFDIANILFKPTSPDSLTWN